MIVRFGSVTVAPARRAALAAAAAMVVASGGIQHAAAANAPVPAHAAHAESAASSAAAVVVVGHYTVRAGQSLNDVAAELAQTHDKATLARVSRELFEANPNAFMKHGALAHDPSRMRVGAVLGVPAISGIPVSVLRGEAAAESSAAKDVSAAGEKAAAESAAASQAPGGASAAPAADASTAQVGAAAVGASTPQVGAAVTAASAAQAGAVAAGAAATGASTTSQVGTTAAAAAASAASAASAGTTAVASASSAAVGVSAPEASAAVAASAAVVAGASSAATAAASATPTSDTHVWAGAIQAAPVGSSGASASAVHPQAPVSSIQELLALKNRMLMALQQHGIGKPAQGGNNAPTAGVPSTPAAGATHGASEGAAQWSPSVVGIAAAFAVVVLLLLMRSMMRRRKPESQPPAGEAGVSAPTAPADTAPAPASPKSETAPAAAGVAASSRVKPQDEAEQVVPQPGDTRAQATDAAGFAAATSLGADALPPTLFETPHGASLSTDEADAEPQAHDARSHDEPQPRGVEPGERETQADAAGAASLGAAVSLGVSALPPESIETARVHAEEADRTQRTDEGPHDSIAGEETAPQETREAAAQTESEAAVPTEFPVDVVTALDTLDMPLPPRVGEPAGVAPTPTGPAASPEAIERQSVPLDEPPAPPAGSAIEAGAAGAGSIAGLGAARFGTLSLDFDLNLPPDSAEPLPVFTPEQLARIARNKLDLAHEYIALGDLIGARTLINEVIESNDLATRADAQALLATLAPMS